MRAVVAGFGFLGSQIALELSEAGYEVTVICRRDRTGDFAFVTADLTAAPPAIAAAEWDAAVFCLAPQSREPSAYEQTYVTAQRHFLTATRPQRYIYISSTAVYPENPGTYSENDGSPHSDRARILLAAERLALSHTGSAVLRLAGLYSPERPIYGPRNTEFKEDKLVHFIHRDDAARAVRHAVQLNLTGIYNVHDGRPQWRSVILQNLRPQKTGRTITHEKFFQTGFHPLFTDYFAGRRG